MRSDALAAAIRAARSREALSVAIRDSRAEVRAGRCGNLINLRISIANLALWRRRRPMRSWGYHEIMDAQGSFRRFEGRMAVSDDRFAAAIRWRFRNILYR